ncbi:MAG: HAMP domain-containing histidine kinase [Anaerolineae bacterium]|nr:HAMP domain-containing histidine kinase [Anaerolineae bacterium]
MNQHSIQWRLPLTYAGIALLTAVALASLLLFTLNNYYDRQERRYLAASARALAGQTSRMYADQVPSEDIQAAVSLFAFLAQARVRLLDETMQVTADSGSIHDQPQVAVNFIRAQDPNNEQRWPYLSLRDNEPAPIPPPSEQEPGGYYLGGRRGPFGEFVADGTAPGDYSDQRVTVPIYGMDGETVAYLELSEGPAFGNEIVADVAENGMVAGAIAVLIAILAGMVISRNISRPVLALAEVTRQMADGDLTARVELERRDELGLLAKSFNTMAARVEATVSTLRRFVTDAAHEINTPLTALRTNLELTIGDDMSDPARNDIQQALTELTRLERLTHGLLVLARLEAPDVVHQHSPVDITALLRQMHERYASRAEQNAITLQVELPDEPVVIQADREQIIRLLDNLLDNALKFTPSEGRVILGQRVEAEINTMHLWVQDSGIGIPENDLPELFSRFHRGRNAAAFPGNGLGLVIAKAIVEEHNGQINVDSRGQGTRFTVSLPLGEQNS